MKNTKSGILFSFGFLLILSLIMGGTTVALFTNTTFNTANQFTAGQLEIGLDKDDGVLYFEVENLAPGDVGGAPVVVINKGSLDLQYTIETILTGALAAGSHPIEVSVLDGDGSPINPDHKRMLPAGESEALRVNWLLPLQAGNQYQSGRAELTILVKGEQILPGTDPMPQPDPLPGVNQQCQASGNVQICASVSDSAPPQYATVTVFGRLLVDGVPVSNETMHSTWYYRTTAPSCDIELNNSDGVGACQRRISAATIGYTVDIHVTIGGHTVVTSFTPTSR